MAKVTIDTRHLDQLPNLCVKTGEPTALIRQQSFADIPGWTFLLIFWGLIPFLIASGFARRKVTVDLPVSAETLRRVRLVDVAAVVGLVVGIGLLIAALATGQGVFAWTGIAVAAVTLVGAAVTRLTVWVSGRFDGQILWLYGVHPAFAEQIDAMVAPSQPGKSDNRWTGALLLAAILVLGILLVVLLYARG